MQRVAECIAFANHKGGKGIPISHHAPESQVGKAYAKITESIIVHTNHNKYREGEK